MHAAPSESPRLHGRSEPLVRETRAIRTELARQATWQARRGAGHRLDRSDTAFTAQGGIAPPPSPSQGCISRDASPARGPSECWALRKVPWIRPGKSAVGRRRGLAVVLPKGDGASIARTPTENNIAARIRALWG